MSRSKKSLLAVMSIFLLAGLFWIARPAYYSPEPAAVSANNAVSAPIPAAEQAAHAEPEATEPLLAEDPSPTAESSTVGIVDQVATDATADKEGCVAPLEFLNSPQFLREIERLAPVSVIGKDFEVYLNIELDGLRPFAEQGDSAAMVLLAVQLEAAAGGINGVGISNAMAQFSITGFDFSQGNIVVGDPQPVTADEREALLSEAAYWLRKAIAHGRVMAIPMLGQVRFSLGETALSLGLVTPEAVEALTDSEQRRQLRIAHELAEGILLPDWQGMLARGQSQQPPEPDSALQSLAQSIADQALNDMQELGKSLPQFAPQDPALIELAGRTCR